MKIYLAGGEGRHWIHDMIIYMAGGVSGNLNPAWGKIAKEAYAEPVLPRLAKHMIGDDMKLHLASNGIWRNQGLYDDSIVTHKPYILESFYYIDADTERLLPYYGDFLLDSGAFTFMMDSKTAVNWDEYLERYADFINRNRIDKFFELDIDVVVGYDEVVRLRNKLENLTGQQCIPVWHKSRGMDNFRSTCDAYPYIALGGIVSGEFKSTEYKHFPLLINEAHKRGAKIHGLGFTSLAWLPKCHFDSVDSTAWTTGNRFGFIYRFDGKTMQKTDAPKGHRLADARKVALINYIEWIKFQKYAEVHL